MSARIKVLLIDDETQMRKLVRIGLETAGDFAVIEAGLGEEGLRQFKGYAPEVVLLDLGLPDVSGIEVLERLRSISEVPVIVLSVKDREDDKVQALDAGADDYVTKPFGMGELIARIRVALRHKRKLQRSEPKLSLGHLELDLDQRQCRRDGKELRLSSLEYALLKFFALNEGRVLTHRSILREVWGQQHEADIHYLRIYIAALRKKIERDPANPTLIVTEAGVGYRLRAST